MAQARLRAKPAARPARTRAPEWLIRAFAMLCGLTLFVCVWAVVAGSGDRIPGPAAVWQSALGIFSDPFYQKGPNDQGIGWNVLLSLKRVAIGFGLAALVGIPLGLIELSLIARAERHQRLGDVMADSLVRKGPHS